MELLLGNEAAQEALGARLAKADPRGCMVYLQGPLGAGKTTFVRGFLRGLGHTGIVKSPTYTLVESYHYNDLTVYHLDLYRLIDPEELEFVGVREFLAPDSVCLIEWPECGVNFLPSADIVITLQYLHPGRHITIDTQTPIGSDVLARL